jgi:hypothetical protein
MKLSKTYELQGLIWKSTNENWCRKCPSCNCIIEHTGVWAKSGAARRCRDKIKCHSCASSGKNNPMFGVRMNGNKSWMFGKKISDITKKKMSAVKLGKKLSNNTKEKLSKSQIKRYLNITEKDKTSKSVKEAMYRPDVRKKHLDALYRSQWLKVKTDKGQLELIESFNSFGFNFQPNFQVKTDQDLFYIDGYDQKHNIVLEYDSKYHNKLSQKQKDLVRQNKIIEILKPKKFWRYDGVTKSFTDVIGENDE